MSGVPVSLGRTVRRAPSGPPVRWAEFAQQAPGLAEQVEARFAASRHHVLATLMDSGAPRVSGTEVGWWDGELWVGSVWGARKALDLQADPRFAVHSNPGDGSLRGGDAKVSGSVVEIADGPVRDAFLAANEVPQPLHLFFLRLQAATLTELTSDDAALAVTTWRSGDGIRVVRRT